MASACAITWIFEPFPLSGWKPDLQGEITHEALADTDDPVRAGCPAPGPGGGRSDGAGTAHPQSRRPVAERLGHGCQSVMRAAQAGGLPGHREREAHPLLLRCE